MAEKETSGAAQEPDAIDSGAYDVLRARIAKHAAALEERLTALHEERRKAFGSVELKLVGNQRLTTSHNCVPRDIVCLGDQLVCGYNIQFGLKTEIEPSDVFAAWQYTDGILVERDLSLLQDSRFVEDFRQLYRYYKHTVFARFAEIGPHLFMVFRVGRDVSDIKTFKWVVDGESLRYVDNRSDHECRFPPQHEFEWQRTTRDHHRHGVHPHASIEDRLFVETVGGDLTIKIEDNTESGRGIYAEPVDDPDQTLDDGEIHYAILGNLILLKIRPYQERTYRYFIHNEKTGRATRVDSVGTSCVLLPEDHGIIFAGGYHLQSGEEKIFDGEFEDMLFTNRIASPNGEDWIHVFYRRSTGTYALLPYNLIEQRVSPPIVSSGVALRENGDLFLFRAQETPQKHHPIQIWASPFASESWTHPIVTDSYLHKIGHRDLVRGMADCHALVTLARRGDSRVGLYTDLVRDASNLLDLYFWLGETACFELRDPIAQLRDAARAAVSEHDKVVRLREENRARIASVEEETGSLLRDVQVRKFSGIEDYVETLTGLRTVRGRILSLRDLKFVDESAVEALDGSVAQASDALAARCAEFLLTDEALAPYVERLESERARVPSLVKAIDARELEDRVAREAAGLDLLLETVGELDIADATQRTAIIDRISAVFTVLNGTRAAIRSRRHELASTEGEAEFAAQTRLLDQATLNYLDACDTPEKCDEYLTRVMVEVEELEGRFAEHDEFVSRLIEKRDEFYAAFESRKVALLEKRNKRASTLFSAAERVLTGIRARVDGLATNEAIAGFFASDLLVGKIREIVEELDDLADSVKAEDIRGRLESIRKDAIRQLSDRRDLYSDDGQLIRLGRHSFTVNTQPLDLTTVLRDGRLCVHLTGTKLFVPVDDPDLEALADVRDREFESESDAVYRAEYLVHRFLATEAPSRRALDALADSAPEDRARRLREFMAPRHQEGYVKGVHDVDGTAILEAALDLDRSLGLLRHSPEARSLARFWWQRVLDPEEKARIAERLAALGAVSRAFPSLEPAREWQSELAASLSPIVEVAMPGRGTAELPLEEMASRYLYEELASGAAGFATSAEAARLHESLLARLEAEGAKTALLAALNRAAEDPRSTLRLARDAARLALDDVEASRWIDEIAVLLLVDPATSKVSPASSTRQVDGLVGTHPRIDGGALTIEYPEWNARLERHVRRDAPRFRRLQELKRGLVERERSSLRVDEYRPRVLSSFVRNRLVNEVYLPLIGDNLAKQIGAAGRTKRTDLMGLLLLISPPGYGKTTLMEYVASRLGLIFMKVNGPAIGHEVTSLDPGAAPNAAAREEVEKLNLALEMGDNVLLYLDDIQHCHPELLQKFISLCDAQRKMEGVWRGRSRTYDLRGRKVAVVMAGNPYTESGEVFRIPDMLSNRADTYNLGEIIGANEEAFVLSYLENAMTSNPTLAQIASRSPQDLGPFVRIAATGSRVGNDLEGKWSVEEVEEITSTLAKLLRIRDVVLRVNQEYIRSAGQADAYRTEPPFKLQGSYRNMNRLAEKVLPVMNEAELEALIVGTYEQDVQTLTRDAEANFLKFKEILGVLTDEESLRWEDIKKTFRRNTLLGGAGDDRGAQIVAQLSAFQESLDRVATTLRDGVDRPSQVQVINRLPKTIVDVIRHQFELMRSWMEPLHRSSRAAAERTASLEDAIRRSMASHEEILRRLESTAGDVGLEDS